MSSKKKARKGKAAATVAETFDDVVDRLALTLCLGGGTIPPSVSLSTEDTDWGSRLRHTLHVEPNDDFTGNEVDVKVRLWYDDPEGGVNQVEIMGTGIIPTLEELRALTSGPGWGFRSGPVRRQARRRRS